MAATHRQAKYAVAFSESPQPRSNHLSTVPRFAVIEEQNRIKTRCCDCDKECASLWEPSFTYFSGIELQFLGWSAHSSTTVEFSDPESCDLTRSATAILVRNKYQGLLLIIWRISTSCLRHGITAAKQSTPIQTGQSTHAQVCSDGRMASPKSAQKNWNSRAVYEATPIVLILRGSVAQPK